MKSEYAEKMLHVTEQVSVKPSRQVIEQISNQNYSLKRYYVNSTGVDAE